MGKFFKKLLKKRGNKGRILTHPFSFMTRKHAEQLAVFKKSLNIPSFEGLITFCTCSPITLALEEPRIIALGTNNIFTLHPLGIPLPQIRILSFFLLMEMK